MTVIPYSNRISIRDFLAWRGIQPKYERNGYGMYLSPLREERTPSFKVDYVQNLWYDFGLGEGGTLLTLVMRLEQCDSREAVRRLQNGEKRNAYSASLSPDIYERPVAGGASSAVRPAAVPALRILSDAPLRHPALVSYLSSRGIVPSVAAAFCREIRYEVNGRAFFAVGFRNDAGGWELRSERFKGGSSPKHITTFDNRSDTVIAFICKKYDRYRKFFHLFADLSAQLHSDAAFFYNFSLRISDFRSASQYIITNNSCSVKLCHSAFITSACRHHKPDACRTRFLYCRDRIRSDSVVITKKRSIHIARYHFDHIFISPIYIQ